MVSGVIQNTSDESLKKYFSKYGEIEGIVRSKKDGGKFTRWAFICFQKCESVDKALKQKYHSIDGHSVDCKRGRNFYLNKNQKQTVITLESPNKQAKVPSPILNDVADVVKLMVGELKAITTAASLKKHFLKFGTVLDAYVPTFYGTDKTKGFGYVVMPSKDAKFDYRNHVIDGKSVYISREHQNQFTDKSTTLLVSAGPEIMKKVSEEHLRAFFSRFGKIVSVRKPLDPHTKKCSHYAFVEFNSTNSVDKALEHLAYKVNGSIVCLTKSRFDPYK
jgi:RNA recognition motif-containing protein